MKTKTIFKTLAMAMMMPAMLLTTACSSDDDAVNNGINNNGKGYALPVTVNVTRGGDDATRATYDDGAKTLSFSSGDQLFVKGTDGTAGAFAGTLEWQSDETFCGTIYTENPYSGAADALLGSASSATATLLPAGYGSIGYLTVSGDGYNATLATVASNAFATSKADAVAQLSLEQASAYSSGFALAPQNAILNFTADFGQWRGDPVSSSVSLQAGGTTVSGSVETVEVDRAALAYFAIAVAGGTTPSLTLTVDGTSVSLGTHALTAGKIYNQKCANFNVASPRIQANEKWLVYGTGEPANMRRLTIAAGATVTLSNVNLSDASIVCMGNNTIILADGTTNSVTDAGHIGEVPAIMYMGGDGTTLTIKGTGTLNVTGGNNNPAIGPMGGSCGDITIANTVHLTATAGAGYGKAISTNGGGTVTIGGVVYAGGADSPFTYPAPTLAQTMATAGMTVKVKYIHSEEENYCQFTSNGNGTYTFVSGDGYVGGDGECAKALVVDGDNLVFKQNTNSDIDYDWNLCGFSVTFDTSNNTYSEWIGLYAANEETTPSFISVEVNGTKIDVTKQAAPVTYTELKGGEVLHVGDIINPSEEICIEDEWAYIGGPSDGSSPYTVLRADFTFDGWGNIVAVNEKADGNYYVIKSNTGDYFTFAGNLLSATGTSDGILVTYIGGKYKNCKFSVHEP